MTLAGWEGRRVFVTGHTGFKGSWLCLWLEMLGARVTGFALPPATQPSLSGLLKDCNTHSIIGDIRDAARIRRAMEDAQPEFVFHLAAQAIVRDSYEQPIETFATNVMGTANVLEACRYVTGLQSVVVVTSDKVYEPSSSPEAFHEESRLGGHDPYSASKAAAELTASAWRRSFFAGTQVATARAGNVVGGGDWANHRLVPDIVRAVQQRSVLHIRYPEATRPWQHVLEPLHGYLLLAQAVAQPGETVPLALNFGPRLSSVVSVRNLLQRVQIRWPLLAWTDDAASRAHENPMLAIDASAAEGALGWRPVLTLDQTIDWTLDWYARQREGADAADLCREQIVSFTRLVGWPGTGRRPDSP